MQKRGQVTAFIVIGLIFVLVFGILLYLGYNIEKGQTDAKLEGLQKFSSNVLRVKPYIDNCVKQQAVAALFLASGQGEDLPSLEEMEKIIENYLEENVELCANFEVFEEFDIESGKISADVNVFSENFVANINWPITIRQNDLKVVEENFNVEFPLRLNELYIKVKTITENEGLDLNTVLEQDLNIEITGCSEDKINYVVNDRDYTIEGNILQFFFNTEMEDLENVFEFNQNIEYLPYSLPGKQVLRREGDSKRLLFETTKEGVLENCYDFDNETENYSFGLVEGEEVSTIFSVREAKTVYIRGGSVSSDDLILDRVYDYSSGHNFDSGRVIIKKSSSFVSPIASIFRFTPAGWEELETNLEGDYYYADVDSLGTYALGSSACVALSNSTDFNILFVPIDYENTSLFLEQVEVHRDALLGELGEYSDRVSFNVIVEDNDLHCLDFGSEECNVGLVREIVNEFSNSGQCNIGYNYVVALIDNTVIGLDSMTEDEISFVGSYLTFDDESCASCNTVSEFRSFLGLNENSTREEFREVLEATIR